MKTYLHKAVSDFDKNRKEHYFDLNVNANLNYRINDNY